MGETVSADQVLETRGRSTALDAFVVAAAFDRSRKACAFALGDGTVAILPRGEGAWRREPVHAGAVLALAPDAAPEGWISGGDDGRFHRIAADGGSALIAPFGMRWVEHVASWTDGGKTRLVACAAGKRVALFNAKDDELKTFEHPSTVTGIAFDAKGKRIAASHYNGASLWFVASRSDTPRKLEWKGSHTGIAISPDGDNVVTSMQENALHGWRLSDNQHMRMTGYPSKTRALSFTRNGRWLATSGADSIVLWPFHGGGPMGKPPIELAGGDGVTCTLVACHPQQDMVAAGFADGLVVIADIGSARILPVAAPGRGPVSALAWSPEGAFLAFGTESGFAAVVDLSKR
jgi:WD40 repeat protein